MTASSLHSLPRFEPFVGPRPFDAHEQGVFFGRDQAVEEVARLWLRNRLTVLHGGPGIGKTSMLRAGVVPLLRAQGENVLPPGASTAADPAAALPRINPYTLTLMRSWAPGESPARLAAHSLAGFLQRHERTDRHGAPQPTLVAIDQTERIARGEGPWRRHRRLFLDELCAALAQRPRVHLLVTARTDRLDSVLRVAKRLDDVECARFALGPLPAGAAEEVIRRSLQEAGRRSDMPWIGRLVDGLDTCGVDPVLLQTVCARLWGAAGPSTEPDLPVESGRALLDFCGRTLADVAGRHDVPRDALDAWLRRLPGHVDEPVGEAVAWALEDRHLIDRAPDDDTPYRVRHPLLADAVRKLGPERWPEVSPTAEQVLDAAAATYAADRLDAAEQLTRRVTSLPPARSRTPADAETLLGGIAAQRRRFDDAARHYLAAAGLFDRVRDQSHVVLLLAARGWVEVDDGHPHQAVEWMERALQRDPNNPAVQLWLGVSLKLAGRRRQAVNLLDDAVQRAEDPLVPQRALAAALAESDEPGFAERALREYSRLRSGPFAPFDEATRALAQATMGYTEDARQGVRTALTRDPQSGAVLLTSARVLLRVGDPEDAAGLARRALSADDPPLPPHQRPDAERVMEQADQRRDG